MIPASRILKMDKSLKKAFKKYGLSLEPAGTIYREQIKYNTKLVADKNVIIDTVYIDIYESGGCISFYSGKFDVQIGIISNDVYGTVLKFFKDYNVLTKDEMIIKDIIE